MNAKKQLKGMVKGWTKKGPPGSQCRFAGGRTYVLRSDGSIRRTSPLRPWRGKSERRRVIRQRRLDRALEASADDRSP